METRKKGISLIVLIITIIVMIILAAAIILSISNSGIMDKANKAKKDSDTANLKEYVNVLEAEWELMDTDERSSSEYASKEAYVNAKLEAKGYTQALLMEDGTLYTNLQANAKAALEAGIQIGDVVEGYTLEEIAPGKVYETSGNENTAPSGWGSEGNPTIQPTIKRIEYVAWKYVGIGENGEILIAPDMVTSVDEAQKIKLSGKGGFVNGPTELNDICKRMYSTSKGTARSMNIDDVNRILDYTGFKGMYYNADEEFGTETPLKISEIGTLYYHSAPEINKEAEDYYADAYHISRANGDFLKSVEDEERKEQLTNFIYTTNEYWLASTCVDVQLSTHCAFFGVRVVNSDEVAFSSLYSAER